MNRVLVALLTLLSLTPLTAQSPAKGVAQVASGNAPQSAVAPTAQSGTAQSPTPPDYSQEAYVIEHYRQAARYESDGTGSEQLDARIKVMSESGVQGLGQLKIGYSALSDKLDIVYVRVRKPDGTIVTAQESAVQDLTATPNAPVYTDYHEKHVSVPSLRPGDVLEYKVVRTIVNPLAPNQFWTNFNFAEQGVVLDEELEINVPKARHVTLKTKPGYDPKVTEEGDRRIYRWTHTHQPSGKEQKAPNHADQVPSVQLTTFQSWDDVGAWYAFLERARRQPDDAVKARAAELVRGKTDDMEKVKALYDYVSRNIRYVSLSFGLGRIQPHAASEVLANGYGDCKDKNTLLAALLQSQGIESSSVLIGVERKFDPEVPSPSQFDHVITRVSVGGKDIWLDSTTGVLPFRMLMLPTRDKQALLISQGGKSALVRTPADLPFQASDQTHVNASLNETGKLTAQISATMRGDREVSFRFALRQMPANHWKDLFSAMLQRGGLKGAEISNLQVSDPSDTDSPLRMSLDATASNFFDWSARESQIKLPFMQMSLGGEPGLDEDEKTPQKVIKLGAPSDSLVEVRLQVPDKFAVQAPIGVDVRRDYAEYHSSYKVEGNQLTSIRDLNVLTRELPYERVQDYAAFQRALAADQAQDIVVTNKTPGSLGNGGNQSAADLNESGMQALKNNNLQLAADLFQRVVQQEPKHKSAWNNLGRAYLGLNQNEQAIAAFKKQIEINPYDQYAYNNLGLAYQAELKYEEAIKQFQKQIEINPLDPVAHAALGEVYVKQRNFAAAAPELEKAVSLQPQNALLQISLGQSYIATNQTEKGMAAFEKAISLAPVPITWNNIAFSLAEQNVQLERADKYADAAINSVETQLHDVSLDNLRYQDLATASFLYNVWDTKGWVEFKRGNLDLAEQYVAAAWQASGSGNIGEHLAEIYEKRGDREKAIHHYVLALADNTPSDEARAHLTALGVTQGVDQMVEQGRRELKQQRTVSLNKTGQGTAEFNLLISPAKVEQVKFIKGDDSLKGLLSSLLSAQTGMKFPPGSSVHVPRRGVVTCGTTHPGSPPRSVKTASKSATVSMADKPQTVPGPCTLELRPADSVRSLD